MADLLEGDLDGSVLFEQVERVVGAEVLGEEYFVLLLEETVQMVFLIVRCSVCVKEF